jgi:hypothetical protein
MTVSPTKIYCPSDFKQKRTPTDYQNVTQYNNQQKTQPCQCHQVKLIVHLTLSRKERPLYIRTSHSLVISKNTVMIVTIIKIYYTYDLSRKEHPLSIRTSHSIIINNKHSHDSVTNYNILPI